MPDREPAQSPIQPVVVRSSSPAGPTHHYRTSVTWRGTTGAGYEHYDRAHDGTTSPPTAPLSLSADPAFRGDVARLNPEQLLVLAAASCQLLSFLAVAARARLDVVAYDDHAVGTMVEQDRPARIGRIDLHPHVVVARGERAAGTEADATLRGRIEHLLGVAHRECYIASSLRSEIRIEATIDLV
jgi:organic hydroperoxide reductase OsmC/OhrA